MTEDYRVGKIHSISKLEIEGKDRWSMMIDTGTEVKNSQHEGYYAKTFKIGESVIYAYCVEFNNISRVYKEDYFVKVKHDIEEKQVCLKSKTPKIGQRINGHVVGGQKNRKLKMKLAKAEALVKELKMRLGIKEER